MRHFRSLCRFASNCWTHCPHAYRCSILVMSALLNVMLLILCLNGCAVTPQGIQREQRIYQAGTNFIAGLQAVTPYVPQPVQLPLEMIGGALAAALAAWNLHHQRELKKLKNGNGHANGTPSPSHPPPVNPALANLPPPQ